MMDGTHSTAAVLCQVCAVPTTRLRVVPKVLDEFVAMHLDFGNGARRPSMGIRIR